MAISHVQPLLLLLASLFFLPALCALDFKDCGKGSSPVDVTSVVDIGDTGSASFTISGSTSKIITGGNFMLKLKVGTHILREFYDLCGVMACPVAPGAFVLSSRTVFPFSSEVGFTAHVEVFDSDQDMLMCLDFTSELASSANVLSA